MKTPITLLRITGMICFLFMLFHLAFYRLFGWDQNLACLSLSDRGIMLTYHYVSILMVGFMTFIFLFQAEEILTSKLRYSLLGMIILFFTIRIITEFTHFGWNVSRSPVILLMCLAPVVLLIIALVSNKNQN
ncbi:MAG: hypothetical protein R6X09_00675 [Bacteroidales bacterium]